MRHIFCCRCATVVDILLWHSVMKRERAIILFFVVCSFTKCISTAFRNVLTLVLPLQRIYLYTALGGDVGWAPYLHQEIERHISFLPRALDPHSAEFEALGWVFARSLVMCVCAWHFLLVLLSFLSIPLLISTSPSFPSLSLIVECLRRSADMSSCLRRRPGPF